jgi:ribosomal protein S27E
MPAFSLGRVALILAGVLGVGASVWYLMAGRTSARYRRGEFVVSSCPACREGNLTLENIGRSRRVVRCDNCRSVLRQVRGDEWRYAVDPLPDKDFAERYNEQVLSEDELVEISMGRARRVKTGEA